MFINEVELFKGIPSHIIEEIVGIVKEESISEGQVLFQKGDYADSLFILQEGEINMIEDIEIFRSHILGFRVITISPPVSSKSLWDMESLYRGVCGSRNFPIAWTFRLEIWLGHLLFQMTVLNLPGLIRLLLTDRRVRSPSPPQRFPSGRARRV